MSALDSLEEQRSIRLRQRLWGAAVFIALLVIFLPLILDGSGSESQYRRVESLRAEPPRIFDEKGNLEPVEAIPEQTANARFDLSEVFKPSAKGDVSVQALERTAPVVVTQAPAAEQAVAASRAGKTLTAWVVQAGSFGEQANAIAVRDKLRRAGYPSFITPTDEIVPYHRVRVGPMISLDQAEASRKNVARLLEREAIVVSYP